MTSSNDNPLRYSKEDLDEDLKQIIYVIACGDGGPALVRLRTQMEAFVDEMNSYPETNSAHDIVLIFRRFAKLTEVTGGKCDY